MNNIFSYTLLIISLLISLTCQATEQWTNSGTIEGMYFDTRSASAKLLFRHSHQINPGNCVHDGAFYELKNDGLTSQAATSLLLNAEAQQKQIRVYLSGCAPSGRPLAVILDTVQ